LRFRIIVINVYIIILIVQIFLIRSAAHVLAVVVIARAHEVSLAGVRFLVDNAK
jgi:hypothetical protein